MSRWASNGRLTHLGWVSLVLLVPYLALSIGAEELHRLSCGPHHHDLLATPHTGGPSASSALNGSAELTAKASLPKGSDESALLRASLPGPAGDVHDADSCILCQWLKYSPQGLPPKAEGLVFASNEFDYDIPNAPYQVLSPEWKSSRAPPT